MSVGWRECLPSIPGSITDPFLGRRPGARQRRKGGPRNLPGMVLYPDDLLRFQTRRLAVS